MNLTPEIINQLQPGKTLDSAVAECVMGLQPCTGWAYSGMMRIQKCWTRTDACTHGKDECFWVENPIEYSQNIAAAWLVLEKIWHTRKCGWTLDCTGKPFYAAFFDPFIGAPGYPSDCFLAEAKAETMPLAICRSALLSTLS